jgi:hypothetical protein
VFGLLGRPSNCTMMVDDTSIFWVIDLLQCGYRYFRLFFVDSSSKDEVKEGRLSTIVCPPSDLCCSTLTLWNRYVFSRVRLS